jgi:hypothetical protein
MIKRLILKEISNKYSNNMIFKHNNISLRHNINILSKIKYYIPSNKK